MYTPLADEKLTSIMVYGRDKLIRGDVVTKQSIMVSRWLRTQGAPTYMHILRANIISFGASGLRVSNCEEVYFPVVECLAYHLTPPASDPLDYEPDEQNRLMQPMTLLAGGFLLSGKLRVSAATDLPTGMEGNRLTWLSFYEIEVSNPALPQMHLQVPMALINAPVLTFSIGHKAA
jgi:hypothetical protein